MAFVIFFLTFCFVVCHYYFCCCYIYFLPSLIFSQRELQSLLYVTPQQTGDFVGLDDWDNEDEDGGNYVLHFRTALLEVKKGAITAIGEMTAHTMIFEPESLTIHVSVGERAAEKRLTKVELGMLFNPDLKK